MSVKIELVFASVQEAANALAKLGAPTTAAPTPAAPEKAATAKAETKKNRWFPGFVLCGPAASPASAEPKADAVEKTPKADAPTYEKSGLPRRSRPRSARTRPAWSRC